MRGGNTALDFLNKKREEHYASGGLALGIDQIRPMLAQWMDEWADTKQKLNIHGVMQAEGSDEMCGSDCCPNDGRCEHCQNPIRKGG